MLPPVCVLLTSVSLKLIKIKIKFIYATTSSWGKNKMAGESLVIPTDFIFLFINPSCFFFLYDPSWSESNFILFLFFYSIRVGPSLSGLDWSELIRSDFCTYLFLAAYFNEPDHDGHKFGPNSPEIKSVIRRMDNVTGYLLESLRNRGLLNQVRRSKLK